MSLPTTIDCRISRRAMIAGAAVAAGAAAFGVTLRTAAQSQPFASGGIGLTRAEFEETFGPGEQVETPGHPIYDSMYAHGTQIGTVYAWYVTNNGEEYVAYIEIAIEGMGLEMVAARKTAESLLPDDATFSELYVAPVTPSGPLAIELHRYTSATLGTNHPGAFPSEIVVMFQELWEKADAAVRVTLISATVRMVTQAG